MNTYLARLEELDDCSLVCEYVGSLAGCYAFLTWQVNQDMQVRRTHLSAPMLDNLALVMQNLEEAEQDGDKWFNMEGRKYRYLIKPKGATR